MENWPGSPFACFVRGLDGMVRTFYAYLVIGVFLFAHQAAFGWGYPTHSQMTYEIFRHPSMKKYVDAFPRFGLDVDKIAIGCNHEPPSTPINYNHPGWSNLSNLKYRPARGYAPSFVKWEITNERLSNMLHAACDCSVPICHSPSNSVYGKSAQGWDNKRREDKFEAFGIFHKPPALRKKDILTGTFEEKIKTWRKRQLKIAKRFRDHKGPDGVFYDDCLRSGMALAQAVLIEYCERNKIKVLPTKNTTQTTPAKKTDKGAPRLAEKALREPKRSKKSTKSQDRPPPSRPQ